MSYNAFINQIFKGKAKKRTQYVTELVISYLPSIIDTLLKVLEGCGAGVLL